MDEERKTMSQNLKEHEKNSKLVNLCEQVGKNNILAHGLEYIEEALVHKTKCVKCGLFILEREGCFACIGCPYTTHKACAKLPGKISGHPFVAELSLLDGQWVLPESHCYYCREAMQSPSGDPIYIGRSENGDRFGSFSDKYFVMHAACALTPLPVMVQPGEYICHRRQMSLAEKAVGTAGECFSCGSRSWGGPVSRCTGSSRRTIFFHKSCAELPRTTLHPSHGNMGRDPGIPLEPCKACGKTGCGHGHELRLTVSRPETCTACAKTGCRHVYYCHERTRLGRSGGECETFVLGAECAFQTRTTPSHLVTSHNHEIFLVEGRPVNFHCNGCRKFHYTGGANISTELQRTRDVSFRCSECVLNFHFLCGPLPPTVKFEFHIHPLCLVDKYIEDDSGEYCCDVCEEDRDPHFRVYLCANCKFVAHVHCLYDQVMMLLKEENSEGVELMILGENLPNGSAEIKSSKASQECFEDLIDIHERSTVNDSPTENEILSDQGQRLMTFLNGNKEHKIIDGVTTAEDFYRLNSTSFSDLCSRISTNNKRKYFFYLLDDKYLRMKLVDVQGYMVPWALASDLKMLLDKNGDLGKDSSLTPPWKSFAASLLCAVVNQMRYTMAEDMSMKDVKFWLSTLQRVKKIAGFKVRECDHIEEAVVTTFLGFEAIRFEKEAKKKIEQKIADLESELERWKGKNKKLDQLASMKSDFMTECLRKASRSKWKTAYNLF